MGKGEGELDGGARAGRDADEGSRICHRWCPEDGHGDKLVACGYDEGGDGGGCRRVDGRAVYEEGWGGGVGEDRVDGGPDGGVVSDTCDYDGSCGNGLKSGHGGDLGRWECGSEGLGASSGAVVDYEG